jgi:hypothetical protein
MALVNPNIAMSFRQPEFRPRNALAEYAQVQQIVGGQRQAEMADMQMEDLRRERGVLGQIAAAISAKGGPDLRTASLLMMQNPRTSEQGYNIYQALQKQQRLDEYERQFGGGAGAPTTPTSAAGAITGAAPAAAEPVKSTDFDMRSHVEEKGTPESPFIEVMPYESSPTSTQRRAQGKSQAELRGMLQSESESGRPLVRYVNPMDSASGRVFSYSMPTTTNPFLAEPLPPFEPISEPAPAAAVQTNALAPTAPPANLNQLAAAGGAAPDIDALMRRYNLASKAGSPDAAVLLKQIDAALRGDQNKPITVSRGQVVIDPRTGRQIFAAPEAKPDTVPASVREVQAYLQMTPEERAVFEKLQKIKGTNVTATATATSPTGKSLAGPVGARAEASLVKAEGAAGIMENANMVREALNTGNVIAGPLAGVRTKFAQILELAGAGDKEKLVNTRNTIQGLASLTLESRAELKGQGQVTDTETKLLERARSADINELTIAELQQVVNVSQRLANRMWSNHQSLLKTMEGDPAATDSIRYYRPTMSLPQAIGEGRPATPAQTDKRKQGLDAIFGGGR